MAQDDGQAIAMVYAQALFELALERDQLEVVGPELIGLKQLLEQQGEFAVFLGSPSIGRERKSVSLSRMFAGRVSGLMMNFLKEVNRRDRLVLLGEIVDCYAKLEDKHSGIAKGTLVTATKLGDKEYIRLSEQISRKLGRKLTLLAEIEESIIGGMILTVEGVVMDGSIRRSLQEFSRDAKQQMSGKLPSIGGSVIEN
jgi:F-type H+-transporting ATPase subunit delta